MNTYEVRVVSPQGVTGNTWTVQASSLGVAMRRAIGNDPRYERWAESGGVSMWARRVP